MPTESEYRQMKLSKLKKLVDAKLPAGVSSDTFSMNDMIHFLVNNALPQSYHDGQNALAQHHQEALDAEQKLKRRAEEMQKRQQERDELANAHLQNMKIAKGAALYGSYAQDSSRVYFGLEDTKGCLYYLDYNRHVESSDGMEYDVSMHEVGTYTKDGSSGVVRLKPAAAW
eukprot:PhF_6_TR41169/c0_g1_i2/m.62326